MASSRLSLHERYRIQALLQAGNSLRTIALIVQRSASTISRELRRNRSGHRYHPEAAHQLMCRRRRQASCRRRISLERIAQINALLVQDLSPQQISGSAGLASHEWIYQHIYADQRRGGNLFKQLRRRHRQRRKRGLRDGSGQLQHRRHWSERPVVVETRSRIGDWELDSMRASTGKAVIVTMTERRSRLHLLAFSPDGTASNVRDAIVRRLGKLRSVVHTLTSDNGKEFAAHKMIARALDADFYFADPYSAWQRGSNENANGLVRQYLPRSMDFSTITDDYLRWIEQRLYNRPRKILGYRTHLAVFGEKSINTVANQT